MNANTPVNFSITINETQATELLRLLDIAVKAGGLAVAGNVIFFHNLIQAAHTEATKPA